MPSYEPIRTIINSGSQPDTIERLLKRFTFICLVFNAAISFTLIMSLLVVSQYTTAIMVCAMAYVTIFMVVSATGSVLYFYVILFKKHPTRSLPHPYPQPNADAYYGEGGHRQSTSIANRKSMDQGSELEAIDEIDVEGQYYQVPPYDDTQYPPPSTVASNHYVNNMKTAHLEDGERAVSKLDGALYEIAEGSLPKHRLEESEIPPDNLATRVKRKRSSFEPPESPIRNPIRDETRRHPRHAAGSGSRQVGVGGVVENAPRVRRQPFSPTWSQLTGGVLGDSQRRETGQGGRAGLRANWNKRAG
ncbi:hypothetical protein F5Y04DRAFT_290234 [Hypomontagnella monticulosa]|nr:hypothetical protein F5Y04DRAFT_290234 [Hypomontagnella monticulosa]